MDFWKYDVTYGMVLQELPLILDVLRRADVSGYVFHGTAAGILQAVRMTGRSDVQTKDIDLLVFSNGDVKRMYDAIVKGEEGIPIYKTCTPIFGSMDGQENIGMRGLDITTHGGIRIEVRNGLFYTDTQDPKNTITTGDRRSVESVCLLREMTGYLEDIYVNLRPLELLVNDAKEMADHHRSQQEISLAKLQELKGLEQAMHVV